MKRASHVLLRLSTIVCSVLLASPTWKGKLPKGVKRVVQGDTGFLGTLTRTQLIEPKDLPNVQRIQKEYKLQPLSAFLGKPAPHDDGADDNAFIRAYHDLRRGFMGKPETPPIEDSELLRRYHQFQTPRG